MTFVKDFIRDQEKLYAVVNKQIYEFRLNDYKYEYLGDNKYNIGKEIDKLKCYKLDENLFFTKEKAMLRLKDIKNKKIETDDKRKSKDLYKKEKTDLNKKRLREPYYSESRVEKHGVYIQENLKGNLKSKPKKPKNNLCFSCGMPMDNYGRCGCS